MDKLTIGDRIRAARKEQKLTQETLAERVDVSPYYIGEIERGTKTPSLDLFIKLVEALNVSADYLLRDTVFRMLTAQTLSRVSSFLQTSYSHWFNSQALTSDLCFSYSGKCSAVR